MTVALTTSQKQLCNMLQCGLSLVERPFAAIGNAIGHDEAIILAETQNLKTSGVLRRIAALVNYRAIGRVSVLVTAQAPEPKLAEIVPEVNRLSGVSHNYLRDHSYNLWFTLQADSDHDIEQILRRLREQFGIEFHAMPAVKIFKLDVRFDAFSGGRALLPCDEHSQITSSSAKLTDDQKAVLAALAKEIEITPEPFRVAGFEDQDVLNIARELIDNGIIRRIAAVMDYRKLGFGANAMLVCSVEEQSIEATAKSLSELNCVSHCYQRQTFKGWPYNLFAMMHGRDLSKLKQEASNFARRHLISRYELLATVEEFKKKPVQF